MIDYAAARAKLQRRIEARRARLTPDDPETEVARCDHSWQVFRQTIQADNPRFDGIAFYRVSGCPKCQVKRRLSLCVQR